LALQDELVQVRANVRVAAVPNFPDEIAIRSILLREVGAIELSGDIERQRILFKCVLKTITLTPIQGQYSGETVEIDLREEGWPEFWREVAGSD
jgi:hypothetical protein